MSNKKAIMFGVISLVLALAYIFAIESDSNEVKTVFIAIFVLGVFILLTNTLFAKIRALHSKAIYYMIMTLGLVFFVFILPFFNIWLSGWQAKIIVSIIVSMSIMLPVVFFDKILGITIVPWEKRK